MTLDRAMMKRPTSNSPARQRAALRMLLPAAAFLLSVVLALPAAAQKTDVVTLVNGDTITGEIKSIDKGLIQFSTTGMGTIDIKWAYVASINTDKTLEVELSSGQRVYGAVGPGDDSGTLEVTSGAGSMPVSLGAVAEVWPIGKSFWQKQQGKLDFGFSFTRSSNQLQYTLNANNTFNGRGYRVPVTVSSAVTRVDGATTTNRHSLDGSFIKDLRWQKWFGIVLGGYQSNDELDLDYRGTGGGGAGRYLMESSRAEWALYGAVVATQESYSESPSATGASALAGTHLGLFVYGEHDLTFHIDLRGIPSITGDNRIRVELSTAVNYELFSSLYLGFNFYDMYDSNPPQDTAQQNDFGVSTTVGYKW